MNKEATDTENTGGTPSEEEAVGAGGEENASEQTPKTEEEKSPKEGGEHDQSDDGNKSDEEKSDDKSDDKSEDEPEGAPDKYEDFKLPEGIEVDTEQMSRLQDFGKSHDLSQSAAQELVDLHMEALDRFTTSQQDQWEKVKADWADEVRADKSLHDENGSADAAISRAAGAVKAIGGDELKDALELTGAGSHPAVVKAFEKIGAAMQQDKMVFGGAASDTRTAEQRLYPTMDK